MKNQKLLFLLAMLLISGSIFAQIKVTGTVLDEGGSPLPGANVIELGAQNGTTTDFDGNFKFTTKSNSGKIEISYLGYKKLVVLFSSTKNSFKNVQLKTDDNVLNEVVVVGYGSDRKQDLSTAIASVKLDENAKSRPSTDITSLLQGQLPGLTAQSNGGNPFAGNSISIRGRGSRNDFGALYVVDGVPNAPFNVEDVESVSVLKDGASAAMYGSFVGANGVIIITTKKAKKGLQISLNTSKGVAKSTNLPTPLNAEQFAKVTKDAYAEVGGNYPTILDNPYFLKTRTNWFDEIFRNAFIDHHAVSVAGGNDKIKAFGSFSYDKKEGTLINTYKETFGAILKADFEATKWLTISERLSFTNESGQGNLNTRSHEGVLAQAMMYPRSSSVYELDDNGNIRLDDYGNPLYHGTIPRKLLGTVAGFGEFRNPYATLKRLREYRPSNRIYSTTSLSVKPIEGVTLKSEYTAGFDLSRFESFSPKIPEPGRPKANNSRSISNSYNKNWLWENTVNYKKTFGDDHKLDLLAGFVAQEQSYRFSSVTGQNFDREDKYGTILANGKDYKFQQAGEAISMVRGTSIMGRANYSFADRYFVTASIRGDKTSKLPKGNKSGWFKAASAAWKISSEPFFENLKESVDLLKLRASWGQIGNVNSLPTYAAAVSKLSKSDWISYFGKDLQTGVQGTFLKTVINSDLTWETTEQLDFGLDVSLFNSLEITLDYFEKTTKDLIDKAEIPSIAPYDPPYVNIGKVSNKGWELGVKFNNRINEDFSYNIHANFTHIKNKLVEMDQREITHGGQDVSPFVGILRSTQGQPWYSYYLYKTNGIFKSQQEIDSYVFTDPITKNKNLIQPNARPGDLKYVDINHDGKINESDREYMGSYLPKITYSFGAGANYKGFDFSIYFQGVSGIKAFNAFKVYELNARGQEGYLSTKVLNSWNYNKNSGTPRLGLAEDKNSNYSRSSDFFLEDASYLRIKNITLGYTLPKLLMKRIGAENARLRLYINGENLHTFTKYSGLDPEVGGIGVDAGNYPLARVFSIGLNFNY